LKSIHMIPVLPTESSKANSTEYLGMLMIWNPATLPYC
jgi:hypothetical protein